MMQALRDAFAKTKGRLFWAQWAGNFLLMLLAAGWLQIPDSHTWQFLSSMLSALLLVVTFFWFYAATFRYLLPYAPRPQWWRSCLFLAVCVAVWWLLLKPIEAARAHEALFAGYWNSQSPAWLRARLGYSSLVARQERIYDCIQWILAGLLLPIAVQSAACGTHSGWLGRAVRPYRHWLYWLAVVVCGWVSNTLTWALADWTPDAGLMGQTVSVIARLGGAYTADMLLWCFLLSLIAHYEKDKR